VRDGRYQLSMELSVVVRARGAVPAQGLMRAHSVLALATLVGGLTPAILAQPGRPAERRADFVLSAPDWRIHEDTDGQGVERGMPETDLTAPGWIPATVPGNIQADLEAAHHLKPLWYGLGDPGLHQVARKTGGIARTLSRPSRLRVNASPWFSTVLTTSARSFSTAGSWAATLVCSSGLGSTSVTGCARARSTLWQSASPGCRRSLPRSLFARTVRVVVNDATHFLRGIESTPKTLKELKSPTNWGWIGREHLDAGNLEDVRLEATGPARIDWTRVQTGLSADHAKATVTVTLEIDSQADLPQRPISELPGQGRRQASELRPC